MSLLCLERVSKCYRRGRREFVGLREVSMSVDAGELVAVLGMRESGRTTLARIAAGLERPDEGSVCFDGVDLARARNVVGRRLVLCGNAFCAMAGETVIEHVAAGPIAQRVPPRRARRVAEEALHRAGVVGCADLMPCELDRSERAQVSIARGLALSPAMIVLDDLTSGIGLLRGDPVLRLVRSIVVDGVAVLMCTDDAMCVSGADRVLMLDAGTMRGETVPTLADVVPLHVDRDRDGADAT